MEMQLDHEIEGEKTRFHILKKLAIQPHEHRRRFEGVRRTFPVRESIGGHRGGGVRSRLLFKTWGGPAGTYPGGSRGFTPRGGGPGDPKK